MGDKYVTSNATNKETEIVHRENPLDAIVKATKPEKRPNPPEGDLVAGDDTIAASNAVFEGKEESVAIDQQKEITYGHCNNCRIELTEDKVNKQEIDWIRNEDGTLSKSASRFSVFCKSCMKFITIIDHNAAKMLQDMIRKNVKN
jgi:L-cysteine desulfidase